MGRRLTSLLGIGAVLAALMAALIAYSSDHVHYDWCITRNPADPVVLNWTEDIDDEMASVEHFAPPRVEIMADGRVIVNATAVSVLPAGPLNALVHRILTDLGPLSPAHDRVVQVPLQSGAGGQGREDISVWPTNQAEVQGTVIYNYVPATASRTVPVKAPGSRAVPPLDAGLPTAWKDAVDTLDNLALQTLATGAPYESADVSVLVSFDPDFLDLVGGGELKTTKTKRAWPTGIPHVSAYQPNDGSNYGMQSFLITGAGVPVARSAFVQFLHWPSTAQLYDDGIAGQHYGWYGIWRAVTPGEQNPSAIPVRCAEKASSPQTA
jgi:hypothetical protein